MEYLFQRHGAGTGERREREMSHAGAGGEIVKYYNQRFLVTLSASVPRILTDWGRGPVLIVLLNKQQQHLTMKEVATIHAQTKKMIPHVVSNAIRTFF